MAPTTALTMCANSIYTWHLAIAMRPRMWVFNSVGRLGHDAEGNGGKEGRITVQYQFTRPGNDITLFSRTMTIEAYKDAPLPDALFERLGVPREKAEAVVGKVLEAEVLLREMAAQFGQA